MCGIEKGHIYGCLGIIFVASFFTVLICLCIDHYINSNSNQVKENNKVDSIKKENDKLILEVNNLDSIKNAEIIEVKSLDNDSTVKLFYKLICE